MLILSRVREAVLGGASTEAAVAHAITSTAGVVTSAAAVMIAVFAVFATPGAIEFKQMGVGLAAAILIDATIVRAVLLPATMKLLGETGTGICRAGWHRGHEPARSRRSAPETTNDERETTWRPPSTGRAAARPARTRSCGPGARRPRA